GGSMHAPGDGITGCTPGALYTCTAGKDFATLPTCQLLNSCTYGCQTQPSNQFQYSDKCLAGPSPLALSPTSVLGGSRVVGAATMQINHANGLTVPCGSAYAAACVHPHTTDYTATAVPSSVPLSAASTSVTFPIQTAVVTSVSTAFIWDDIDYEIPTSGGGAY